MQSNINAAKILVFLDFGGVSQLLQMLIFLQCELCDRPVLSFLTAQVGFFDGIGSGQLCAGAGQGNLA